MIRLYNLLNNENKLYDSLHLGELWKKYKGGQASFLVASIIRR